ncbi:MAG: hypothetical protein JWQ09_5798 [Segetibacter sp.]|nr:hypothetical protein [Segetibacter sp.]
MARPESNTVNYFPHFISDGKKMFFIEKKYGNDGYSTWFKILEKLASTENHFLNLNEEEEIIYLSAKCNISEELLMGIITDLTRIGAFDKRLWDNNIIWCQKFIDEIQEAYRRRSNKCMSYDSLCSHLRSLCILKDDIKPQSRVDKSRVDVSKDTIVGLPTSTTTKEISFEDKCSSFINKFNELKGSKYQVTEKVKKALKARLKKYSGTVIISVLRVALKDPKHINDNFIYLTPEFILREEIIERYSNIKGDFVTNQPKNYSYDQPNLSLQP